MNFSSLTTVVATSLSTLVLSTSVINKPDHCGQVDQAMQHYNLGNANTCQFEKRTATSYCNQLKKYPVLYLRNSVYKTHAEVIRDSRQLDVQNARFNVRLFFVMKNFCPDRIREF